MSTETSASESVTPPQNPDPTAIANGSAEAARDPNAPNEAPPVEVTPSQAEVPSAEVAPAQDETSVAEAARVQINASNAETMKPVGSVEADAEEKPVSAPPPAEPTEIPRAKDTQLEADLEAEIAAAMSASSAAPVVVPDAETGEAAQVASPTDELNPGTRRKGKIVSINGENLILDIGTRYSGIIGARSFEEGKVPEVGATIDVVVDKLDAAEGLYQLKIGKGVSRPQGNWDALAVDQIVEALVTKTNKGGLEVTVSNIRGFLPASQIDFGFVQNMEQYVGQKLKVKVTEVNPAKRNLVVSRKAFLDIERSENRENLWKSLEVGQTHTGTVKTIKDYGAFVDLGGVDGLLHVGEMSWTRVNHPSDVVQQDQKIEVKILSIDRDKMKVSLGMRHKQSNPWMSAAQKYTPASTVHGKVTKATDFGAFVELEPGIEGLIHISELDHKRVARVTDVVKVGQEVDVSVISVDFDKKRIALSLKALIAKPQSAPAKSDEDFAPSGGATYQRKRSGPLRGGGTGSGGGLFGRGTEEN